MCESMGTCESVCVYSSPTEFHAQKVCSETSVACMSTLYTSKEKSEKGILSSPYS